MTLRPHAWMPPSSTPGLRPSLLGRDCLLEVPELQRAVLGSGEQSRLAVMESQGADAIIVGAESELGVPGLLEGIFAVRQLGWGSCLRVCPSRPVVPIPSPTWSRVWHTGASGPGRTASFSPHAAPPHSLSEFLQYAGPMLASEEAMVSPSPGVSPFKRAWGRCQRSSPLQRRSTSSAMNFRCTERRCRAARPPLCGSVRLSWGADT